MLCSQTKEIEGAILNEFEVENIHILNTTSRLNTITDAAGEFAIKASVNDTLFISSVKYAPQKVVISEIEFKKGALEITLKEFVNELDEIYLGTRLTGNILIDAKKIKTVTASNKFAMFIKNMEYEHQYTPDGQTVFQGKVSEEALNSTSLKNGINFKSLFQLANKAVFGDSQKGTTNIQTEKTDFKTNLSERFRPEYIENIFKIPESKVLGFFNFLEKNGMDTELLKPDNELELLNFMFERANIFKRQMD